MSAIAWAVSATAVQAPCARAGGPPWHGTESCTFVRHLSERPCADDLGLANKGLAHCLCVEVARIQSSHESDEDPILSASSV